MLYSLHDAMEAPGQGEQEEGDEDSMATLICRSCGAENREDAIACYRCQAVLSKTDAPDVRPGMGASKTGLMPRIPGVRLDATFWLAWVGAIVVLGAFALLRQPSVGLWSDLIGAASIALLLVVAFQIPHLGGYGDLSVGGVSALASLSAQRLFNQGMLASILSGLVVGFVFGLGLAVLGVRSHKKSWWVTGFVGLLSVVATATWELHGAQQPPRPDLILPGDMTGPLSALIPALIALLGLYMVVFQSAFGAQVRSAPPSFKDPEGEKTIRAMFLISGIVSGFAGACAGALLANAGLGHASMFLLSPLTLVFLSGSSLNLRLLRLENLAPAAVIFATCVYLISAPGWTHVAGAGEVAWKRSVQLLPLTDGAIGFGFALVMISVLVFRDKVLLLIPIDESLMDATSSHGRSSRGKGRATRGARPPGSPRFSSQLLALFVCVLLLGIGVMIYSTAFHSGVSDGAILRGLSGHVQKKISNKSSWTRAERGDVLFAGDSLQTEAKSSALLRLPGKNAVRVAPETTLTFGDLSDPVTNRHKTTLLAATGELWAEVTEHLQGAHDSSFEIQTPVATAAVRGTQFSTQTSGYESRIAVNKGAVQVSDGRQTVTVHAGEKCAATRRAGVQFPVPMSPQELDAWKKRSIELHGALSVNVSGATRKVLVGLLALMIIIGIVAEIIYGDSRPDY